MGPGKGGPWYGWGLLVTFGSFENFQSLAGLLGPYSSGEGHGRAMRQAIRRTQVPIGQTQKMLLNMRLMLSHDRNPSSITFISILYWTQVDTDISKVI